MLGGITYRLWDRTYADQKDPDRLLPKIAKTSPKRILAQQMRANEGRFHGTYHCSCLLA